MAYDLLLANRVANLLKQENVVFTEKKMFGGIAFMIDDKMCVGVSKDRLMLRCLDHHYDTVLQKKHALAMEFTGRPMKGFIFIEPDGMKTEKQLQSWIQYGIEFGKYGVVKSKSKTKK